MRAEGGCVTRHFEIDPDDGILECIEPGLGSGNPRFRYLRRLLLRSQLPPRCTHDWTSPSFCPTPEQPTP